MYKETMREGIFADIEGNIYSNKSGIMKPVKPCKVHNSRSKKQYWTTSYGLVHRLVASAFIKDPTGFVINHLDGNPSNNRVSNLEVVTQKENHLHAIANGFAPLGEHHGRAQYSDFLLLTALREILSGSSVRSTALKHGISQSYLNRLKNKVYRKDLWDHLNEQV